MLKRILAFALLAILLLGLIAPAAYATEETTAATEAEEEKLGGWLSNDFKWELVDGTLTITGEGAMPGEAPWKKYANQIENLFFDGDIYTVQAGAFRECLMLKEIQFSSALTEIGDYAFAGCISIEEIRLPDTFRRFGTMCFGGCESLSKVYCEGYMPRFEESCLWNGGEIDIFYAPEKPWGVEDVKVLERNFGGRLEVLCTDGTDPIPEEGEEEEQTQQVEETVPPTTEAPTVPTTIATEPPTEPTVPETTVPETTVPATTEPQVILDETVPEPTVQLIAPTEEAPAEIEEETVKGGFIGLVLIVGVLTFFIVGALVFKIRSRGGRY